jgi:hypothetical protein
MDRPGLSLLSPQGLNSVVIVNCGLDCNQKFKYRSMSCSFVLRALLCACHSGDVTGLHTILSIWKECRIPQLW